MRQLTRHGTAAGIILLLLLWEVAGLNGWVAQGVLPAPSTVLLQMFIDRTQYWPHVWATARAAALGFVYGNLAALAVAMLILRWPRLEAWTAGINIAIFSVPPIAVVPVLLILLDANTERVVLAALAVYYPSLIAAILGLRSADARMVDLVHAYGGGAVAVLQWVRLRAGLPTILAGMRIAAPNAVLGAILGEFGSGLRWGLGSFLLGSMGRADPVRLWGIGLAATALAGTAYFATWVIARAVTRGTASATLAPGVAPVHRARFGTRQALKLFLIVLIPFAVWWGLLAAAGLSPIIAKTPAGIFEYLFLADGAADSRAALGAALAVTLPQAFLGLGIGIAFAFALAVTGVLAPWLVRGFMPVALVSQTMPLVALTPLVVLLLGRGLAATIAITISVTFFPAFVTIAQGLAEVPAVAFDVVRSYGAGPLKRLYLVAIPAALPHSLAAARLAAPRAMLGVMIAEWLATGDGLGGLLDQSRGMLDYGMIWSVAFVAVAVAAAFYSAVGMIERLLNR